MFKRIAILKRTAVVLVVVLLLAAISMAVYANANGNGTEQVNWQIAGPVYNGIQIIDSRLVDAGRYVLISLSAKGSPGTAQIQVSGTVEWAPFDEQCPPHEPEEPDDSFTTVQLKFIDGAFVALFPDQSMLFFEADESEGAANALCVMSSGNNNGALDYFIVGGAGRYENASGKVTVTYESYGVGTNSVLSAETGRVTGVIELP